jgi:lipoprotein-anchoring transpeptidase ErfK/SrfK
MTLAATAAVGFSAIGLSATATQAAPSVVASPHGYAPGTIVVKTNERRLYLILGEGQALRYPVGVGKAGKQWAGATRIDGKYRQPAWSPPADVSVTIRAFPM